MPGSAVIFLRFCVALCAAALLATPGHASAFAGKKVALVVGNSKYPTAPLKNPVNDARAIARTLKELGFEVTLRENAGQRDLAAAVRQFGSSISPGSAALFYFAGHGMQVRGRNYLVPVDADIQLEDEVPYSAIDANLVLDKMEVGKSAVNIVILDACRNNPFSRRFRSSATGLAEMIAPIGTLIAFATAPGSVAQDGTGDNGVYTKHLLESIAMPGLPVEQMFKRVRVGVAKDTNESQVPWESSSMKGDFVFKEAPKQSVSQDRMIEEAVQVAAERAATLMAERMRREQASSSAQADRNRTEQEALAAERERLKRERERIEAERAALRKESPAPAAKVALVAPTAAANPSPRKQGTNASLPEAGDRWTYLFSDGYGKKETYSVRVTEVTAEGIQDEATVGKARHAENHEPGLDMSSRAIGGFALREFSPYLLSLGPAEPNDEWKKIQIPGGSGPFMARWAGKETVKVPAGSYETSKLVVEGEQFVRGVQTRKLTIQAWYAPAVKRFVRLSISTPPLQVGNVSPDRDLIELVETSISVAGIASAPPSDRPPPPKVVAESSPNAITMPGGPVSIGDSWSYRFSDVYGKSGSYTVKVTAASPSEIADEARIGKARHSASFERNLAIIHRKMGDLSLRELSPYLLNFGLKESEELQSVEIFEGKEPFKARLAGTESVRVPAGTFEARKIILEGREYGQRMPHLSRAYTITAWYAPLARRFVKLTFVGAPASLFPAEQETIELTEYRLQ